jgi:hypothetical protein
MQAPSHRTEIGFVCLPAGTPQPGIRVRLQDATELQTAPLPGPRPSFVDGLLALHSLSDVAHGTDAQALPYPPIQRPAATVNDIVDMSYRLSEQYLATRLQPSNGQSSSSRDDVELNFVPKNRTSQTAPQYATLTSPDGKILKGIYERHNEYSDPGTAYPSRRLTLSITAEVELG